MHSSLKVFSRLTAFALVMSTGLYVACSGESNSGDNNKAEDSKANISATMQQQKDSQQTPDLVTREGVIVEFNTRPVSKDVDRVMASDWADVTFRITDAATGLMWMQDDNGEGISWQEALRLAESYEYAGYGDWRLPDAKELQSIIDYNRSPSVTNSAAIDPLFNCTEIINEAGQADYPWYWSSTTHGNLVDGHEGAWGVYLSFGRCLGNMNGWVDIHGAGAQRSDPKSGDPSGYSEGHGPQGDAIRILNYVRLVRNTN